jgi:hypothetical protein
MSNFSDSSHTSHLEEKCLKRIFASVITTANTGLSRFFYIGRRYFGGDTNGSSVPASRIDQVPPHLRRSFGNPASGIGDLIVGAFGGQNTLNSRVRSHRTKHVSFKRNNVVQSQLRISSALCGECSIRLLERNNSDPYKIVRTGHWVDFPCSNGHNWDLGFAKCLRGLLTGPSIKSGEFTIFFASSNRESQ